MTGSGNGWRRLAAALLLLALALGAAPWGSPAPAGAAPKPPRGAPKDLTIVVLADGADPTAAARAMGAKPVYLYTSVFTGFAAKLPPAAAGNRSSLVSGFAPDAPMRAAAQTVPTGVSRVGAAPVGPGDGAAVDADVAVLDSGVAKHPDLDVMTGKNKSKACLGKRATRDNDGHGTHVAGIVGAKDDDAGVVGVAPGARIWAVKVLDGRGNGSRASVICGLDWVHKHRATIDVANLSVEGAGADGPCALDPLHKAVCRVVAAGVPVVVAAGNGNTDAAGVVPAAWPEVIAVSAFTDTDGKPGGAGPRSCGPTALDDGRTWFSNYGPAVDVAAPGECILSLAPKGRTATISGTSQAAPHVTGALARFLAAHPGAGAEAARAWLFAEATRPQDSAVGFANDRDAYPEPVLYLGS